MVPEEVRVIAENLVYDMAFGIKPQGDAAARKWLALARRKYPELENPVVEALHGKCGDPRELPARAV